MMKKNIRFIIYGVILIGCCVGGFIAKNSFDIQNAKTEAEPIDMAYLYWRLNLKEESNPEDEMLSFQAYLDRRGEINTQYLNFSMQADRMYIFYYTTNKFYIACVINIVNDSLGDEFKILKANKSFSALKKQYKVAEAELFYKIDSNNTPIKIEYLLTYTDSEGEVINTYNIIHGRKINTIPDLKPLANGFTLIDGEYHVKIFTYYNVDDEIFDYNQEIYEDCTIRIDFSWESGPIYTNNKLFGNLDEALAYAKAGDTVYLLTDYKTDTLTIPKNVNLFLVSNPTNLKPMIDGIDDTVANKYLTEEELAYFKTIELEVDDLTINGKLTIQATVGYPGSTGNYQGHTSGYYTELIVNNSLECFGSIDCYGFINGNAKANIYGQLYAPMVIKDHRGGTNISGVYPQNIAPFSLYEMPNIALEMTFYNQAKLGAFARICTGSISRGFAYYYLNGVILGDGGLIRLKESGNMKLKYDKLTETTQITFKGGWSDNSFVLDPEGFKLTFDKIFFPLHYGLNIIFEEGEYDLKLKYKILTGSKVTIKKEATVNILGEVAVYEEFIDKSNIKPLYPNLEAGEVHNYGTINIFGSFAGCITAYDNSRVKVDQLAILSIDSKEGSFDDANGLNMYYIKCIAKISYLDQISLIEANKEYDYQY